MATGGSMFPGLVPGSNVSGWNIAVPSAPQQGGQASLGGTTNPFLPTSIGTGTSMPMMPQSAVSTSASSGFPANVGPTPASSPTLTGLGGLTPSGTTPRQQQRTLGELQSQYGEGIGALLYNFLQQGAGYNPQVAAALIAQLQPQFERSQQNLLESFGAAGGRFGSGAQLGLADLLSQQNLTVGDIEAQMYESAVQNYTNVLMDIGKGAAQFTAAQPSTWDKVMGGIKLAASIGLAPFTGGASLAGLASQGASGLFGGGGGGGYSGITTGPSVPAGFSNIDIGGTYG